MKNYSITFFCLCLLASCMVMESQAGVPLPSVTYFGSVRNPYGYPYNKNAEVVLFKGSVECVRFLTTGERSHGMNYRLDLEMDSGESPTNPTPHRLAT